MPIFFFVIVSASPTSMIIKIIPNVLQNLLNACTWWHHQMETFSALLELSAENSPSQRSVTRRFDLFFDVRLNKQLSIQWRRRWFLTPVRSQWLTVVWSYTVWNFIYLGYFALFHLPNNVITKAVTIKHYPHSRSVYIVSQHSSGQISETKHNQENQRQYNMLFYKDVYHLEFEITWNYTWYYKKSFSQI